MKGKSGKPKVVLIDGYIDDPAALGVPPYISPMIRAVAGAAADAGAEVEYLTIDGIRKHAEIPEADVSVVLSGNTVPGKYLRSMPMSAKELRSLAPKLDGWKMIGGSAAFSPDAEGFDFRIAKDLAASLYDGLTGREVGERLRTLDEWNRWMLKGAEIVTSHPDFPRPLMVEIESYRGCHRWSTGGCSFCIEPSKGRPLMRAPEDILGEAKLLKELGVRNVRIGGQTCIISYGSDPDSPCPVPNVDAVRTLFEGLKKLEFDCLCVDNADPAVIATHPSESEEIVRILADCCTSGNVLAMGLESADPVVGMKNNLNATAEQLLEAVKIVNRAGGERGPEGLPKVLPGINLICGLDGETESTYAQDAELLKTILDEGLMVRRINIRQVIDSRRKFNVRINTDRFKRFKEEIRENIDRPMLERCIPAGTVLRGVWTEVRDGNITFGRQPGSYPILVGIPYKVELERSYDVIVTGWGYRSVTGLTYPFEINSMPMSSLSALPGIGKKRASALALKRPFEDYGDLSRAIDDPSVIEGLKGLLSFGGGERNGFQNDCKISVPRRSKNVRRGSRSGFRKSPLGSRLCGCQTERNGQNIRCFEKSYNSRRSAQREGFRLSVSERSPFLSVRTHNNFLRKRTPADQTLRPCRSGTYERAPAGREIGNRYRRKRTGSNRPQRRRRVQNASFRGFS